MGNLALNKIATASGYVAPYTPAKAVDGLTTPFSRWLCTMSPGWFCVDLGESYWVNRWVVRQMGAMGWSPSYNMSNFKFQGSMDNSNWADFDTVTGNTANQTDRTFAPHQARYVRVYVTKGLGINNPFSSISDFETYEAANSPYLTNLVPSVGTLSPGFSQKVFAYTVNVDSGTGSIQFTPTSIQPNMVIKLNGTVVTSGQKSGDIGLQTGNNPVTLTVASCDNSMTTSYSVNVVKAGGTVAQLTGLSLTGSNGAGVALNPGFAPTTFSYNASVGNSITSVKVTPAEGPGTTVTVNGTAVPSGRWATINLNVGSTTITVVASAIGSSPGTYTIVVTRAA